MVVYLDCCWGKQPSYPRYKHWCPTCLLNDVGVRNVKCWWLFNPINQCNNWDKLVGLWRWWLRRSVPRWGTVRWPDVHLMCPVGCRSRGSRGLPSRLRTGTFLSYLKNKRIKMYFSSCHQSINSPGLQYYEKYGLKISSVKWNLENIWWKHSSTSMQHLSPLNVKPYFA